MFLGHAPGGEPALNLSGSPLPSFCPFVALPSSHCCLVFLYRFWGFSCSWSGVLERLAGFYDSVSYHYPLQEATPPRQR